MKIYEKRNQLRRKAQAGKELAKGFKGVNKDNLLKLKT
ncbi:hypothetical protein PITCH_A890001 [uncultured Desulfobacterium sp.]|uniref:Uncharacterized protein n=1 Tax=uncultured Desulfobacterium sp. TaxID=201089 RepID=A0A445N3J6_9BACT|nr:hypothetical protein PITCH_A890001 [uncultured Desulfobacterium sp.]